MEKPNCWGSLEKATTSFALSRNLANSYSKSLSQGTRLKTLLRASRTDGKRRKVPSRRVCGSRLQWSVLAAQLILSLKARAEYVQHDVARYAVVHGLDEFGLFKSTFSPKARFSKKSQTFGASA